MEHTDERPELRLQCDRNLADQLQAALKGMSESRCRVSERKNIHGDASTCVLIATLAIKELPILLSKLRDLADSIGRAYAPLASRFLLSSSVCAKATKPNCAFQSPFTSL